MVPSWFWGRRWKKNNQLALAPTFTPLPTHPLSHHTPKKQEGGGRKRKEECATNLGTCGICILIFPKKERKKFGHVNKFPALFLEPTPENLVCNFFSVRFYSSPLSQNRALPSFYR
jgi:hypothetical protein